ncbi:MAG: HEAT repeat domain-containing protein [Candidatus Riflebacteria bacterium]
MEKTVENFSLKQEFLNQLLSDISSSDPWIRKFAIGQLHGHIESDLVIEAVKKQFEIETDLGCKEELLELIKLIPDEKVDRQSIDGLSGVSEIVDAWIREKESRLSQMVRKVSKLPLPVQAEIFCGVFQKTQSSSRLVPLLSMKKEVLSDPKVTQCLEKILDSKSSMLLFRAINTLTRVYPEAIFPRLPELLVYPDFQVRILSIKALYLLSKEEAIRLLNELVFSKNPVQRRDAFSYLFLLPFNHTSDIVIRLIEQGKLPENLDKILKFLIYNNPDEIFLRRLAISFVLHNQKNPALKSFLLIAAKSLIVAGLIKQPEQDIIKKVIENARSIVAAHIKKKAAPEEGAQKEKSEKADLNKSLEQFKKCGAFSGEQERQLLEICRSKLSNADLLNILGIIKTHELESHEILEWLFGLLDSSDSRIVIETIDLVTNLKAANILPHLPVLVFSENEEISSHAIRVFSNKFPDKAIEKLKQWINSQTIKNQSEIVKKVLLEMNFETAREFILSQIKRTSNGKTISMLGSVLVLNPDRTVSYKLKLISSESNSEKRASILSIADEIDRIIGDKFVEDGRLVQSETNINLKWSGLLLQVKKISYESNDLSISDLFKTRFFNFALIGVLVMVLAVFLLKFDFSFSFKSDKKAVFMKKERYLSVVKPESRKIPKSSTGKTSHERTIIEKPKDFYRLMTVDERKQLQADMEKERERPSGDQQSEFGIIYLERQR